jgi:hypothetical protein
VIRQRIPIAVASHPARTHRGIECRLHVAALIPSGVRPADAAARVAGQTPTETAHRRVNLRDGAWTVAQRHQPHWRHASQFTLTPIA